LIALKVARQFLHERPLLPEVEVANNILCCSKGEQANVRNSNSAAAPKRQLRRFGGLESGGSMGIKSGGALSIKASQVCVDKG